MTVRPLRMLRSLSISSALSLIALAAGCDVGVSAVNATDDGGTMTDDAAAGGRGLPCEVQMVLDTRCGACHGATPAGGAPMPLHTRDQLLKASYVDAGQTFLDRCIARMQAAANPMPPGALPPAADVMVLTAWQKAGAPAGDCNGSSGMDPLGAAPTCTSGTQGVLFESKDMRPGEACITCHAQQNGPNFLAAGTVFPSGHEPNDCNGGVQDTNLGTAQVVLTGADGATITAKVRSHGNFFVEPGSGPLKLPYTAKVVWNGKVRVMNSPQSSGDCNSCHTQDGSQGAPGRVTLPF